MPEYRFEDLKIYNASDAIKRRPEMWTGGRPHEINLAAGMAGTILSLGSSNVCVEQKSPWWVVFSDVDWLAGGDDADPLDSFRYVKINHKLGAFSARTEMVAATLSKVLVTASKGEVVWITGAPEMMDDFDLEKALRKCGDGRVVVYCLDDPYRD